MTSTDPTDAVTGDGCNWSYSNIDNAVETMPGGESNFNKPPGYVDEGGGNFHLASESPCIDAADPSADLNIDIDGDTRPFGGRHDMGADETIE